MTSHQMNQITALHACYLKGYDYNFISNMSLQMTQDCHKKLTPKQSKLLNRLYLKHEHEIFVVSESKKYVKTFGKELRKKYKFVRTKDNICCRSVVSVCPHSQTWHCSHCNTRGIIKFYTAVDKETNKK